MSAVILDTPPPPPSLSLIYISVSYPHDYEQSVITSVSYKILLTLLPEAKSYPSFRNCFVAIGWQ